jgi:hypothetical protein
VTFNLHDCKRNYDSMIELIKNIVLVSLLIGKAVSDLGGCSKGGICDQPSNALGKCGPNNSLNVTVMESCVCAADPAWDKDILDCILCWVEPIANGGNDYELGVALSYSAGISCGNSSSSSSNLFPCLLQCRAIWEIGNTCGDYDNSVSSCICKYHYI